MIKKYTKEIFIEKAIAIHGNKFDYSKVVYINSNTKVTIICKECGTEFTQTPKSHLQNNGCPTCRLKKIGIASKKRMTKKVHGYGIFDSVYSIKDEGIKDCYITWAHILERCFSKNWHKRQPTYKDCSVCDEWLYFSNFKKWFDKHYIKGYAIDKDILLKGNKVYSPETCCFVPQEINNLFIKYNKLRGDLPIGVSFIRNNYVASLHIKDRQIWIGSFKNKEDAFNAYKQAKEQHIKELAQEYFEQGKITEKVYKALLNYKVEIID